MHMHMRAIACARTCAQGVCGLDGDSHMPNIVYVLRSAVWRSIVLCVEVGQAKKRVFGEYSARDYREPHWNRTRPSARMKSPARLVSDPNIRLARRAVSRGELDTQTHTCSRRYAVLHHCILVSG